MLPARYRDPQLVGRGGMGEVYRATDTTLGRAVAIKVLDERLADDETVRRRFEREAHAAARLSGQAGIVTVFDVGEWQGRPFIVMEYVRGESLEDVLRREGAQPPSAVVLWVAQAAVALDQAHAEGVVHRDVKPSNLLLDSQGRVHIADFGVASAAGLDSLTQAGTVIGTAGYLSPEQAEGGAGTPASDRYALGVVAFELLAGSRPFETDNPTAEAAAHVHASIPHLSDRAHSIPPQVDDVFTRALAKDPANRFPSCAAFATALRVALEGAPEPTRVAWHAAPPRRRRVWPLLLLLLLALGGVAAGMVVATNRGGDSRGAVRTVLRQGTPVTVTQQARTIVQTVTAQAPPPATTAATPAGTTPVTAPPPASADGQSLALQGYNKLRAGDYAGALPLLEQAAQKLGGSGTTNEAYNDYNLAYALAKTSGCSDRVLGLLDASESIQGHRTEIDRLRASCS
jgi:serine/threonine-protein kinase